MKLKLGMKIGGAFLIVLVILGIVGYFNWRSITQVDSNMIQYEKLNEIDMISNEDVTQNLLKFHDAFEVYAISPSDAIKEKAYKYLTLAKKGVVKWKKTAAGVQEVEKTADQIQVLLPKIEKALARYVHLVKACKIDHACSETEKKELASVGQSIRNDLNKANSLLERTMEKVIDPGKIAATDMIFKTNQTAIHTVAILTLMGLLLGIALAIGITLNIVRPINRVLGAAKTIAEGDLSYKVVERLNFNGADEIADMAQAVKGMINGIIGKGQSVITGIPDPFIMVDLDRNILYMNEPCAELTGFSIEEAVGKLKGPQVFNPNNLPRCEVCDTLKESEEKDASIIGKKVKMKNRYGKEINLAVSCTPLKNLQGEMMGGMILLRDITKDIEREKVIEENHRLLLEVAKEVQSIANQVATAAEILSSQSDEIAAGAEEQSAQANQVAAAVEEMNATIAEVARNAQEAANRSQEAREVATCGNTVVEDSIRKIQNLAETTQKVAESVEALAEKSREIDKVIDVISDIADQTNLLALNATIEAASAGEAGKGFAVVASEVKELAKQTAESTENVGEAIEQIQEGIRQSVEMIEETLNKVSEATTLAENAGASLQEIVEQAGNTAEMVTGIAAAAQEQTTAVGEITRNVDGIMTVSQQTAQSIAESAHAAKELAALAEQLRLTVQKFNAQG